MRALRLGLMVAMAACSAQMGVWAQTAEHACCPSPEQNKNERLTACCPAAVLASRIDVSAPCAGGNAAVAAPALVFNRSLLAAAPLQRPACIFLPSALSRAPPLG